LKNMLIFIINISLHASTNYSFFTWMLREYCNFEFFSLLIEFIQKNVFFVINQKKSKFKPITLDKS